MQADLRDQDAASLPRRSDVAVDPPVSTGRERSAVDPGAVRLHLGMLMHELSEVLACDQEVEALLVSDVELRRRLAGLRFDHPQLEIDGLSGHSVLGKVDDLQL